MKHLSQFESIIGFPLRLPSLSSPGMFRLFLAMLVFVHHFSSISLGAYAVYVFFVLSGFWVERMWTGRYLNTRNPYITFIVSRVWRLAPTMILVSLVTIVILYFLNTPLSLIFSSNVYHLIFSSVFLVGYSWLSYGPVGTAWSLDIEMQFYVLAPIMLSIFNISDSKSATRLIIVASFFSILGWSLFNTPLLPKYILFFVIGIVSAKRDWMPSFRLAILSLSAFGFIIVATYFSAWRGILIIGANPGPLASYGLPFNVLLALISVPFAIYTTRGRNDALDKMMADLSYIIYLLHWVAVQWFFQFSGDLTLRIEIAVISFAIVPSAALFIWRFFDRPINRSRAKWVASRKVVKSHLPSDEERESDELSSNETRNG